MHENEHVKILFTRNSFVIMLAHFSRTRRFASRMYTYLQLANKLRLARKSIPINQPCSVVEVVELYSGASTHTLQALDAMLREPFLFPYLKSIRAATQGGFYHKRH